MVNMKKQQNRKRWFKVVKTFVKIFIHKPKFVYLGQNIETPSIILSNHVGAIAPLSFELYFNKPFRFWGTYEMNSGLKSVYKYLSTVYYHQKKHWPKLSAKIFSIIAAPVANMFYKGLNLISTYRDLRFRQTLKESIETIKNGQNLVIFPEDSSSGYHDKLKSFFSGFVILARQCLKHGFDLPIFVTYFRKKTKTFVIDKPILCSELLKQNISDDNIAQKMCDRANQLGKINLTTLKLCN